MANVKFYRGASDPTTMSSGNLYFTESGRLWDGTSQKLIGENLRKLIIGEGSVSSNGSLAGGTTDKSLVSGILGPVASAVTTLSTANAGGTMSVAYGANCNTYAPGTMAIGMNISAGCKGYYFDTIDFTNKTITLSSTRRTSTKTAPTYPSSVAWSAGDVITIFNEGCYPCCATIKSISGNVITLNETLPFTSIAYSATLTLYTYDMPHDRTVVNNSKPNAGVVELGFGSVAMGGGYNTTNQANRATGLLSYAFGYGNLSAGNFSTTFGRENKAGQCALAIGQNCSALGTQSFAGGHNSETSVIANKGFAFGGEAKAQNDYAVAFGLRSYATGYNAFSNGVDTTASGRHAVAFGEEGIASGRCSLFIGSIPGDGTACNGPDNTTTFTPKGATGGYSVAIGQMNSATNTGSVAIGAKNQSTATYSFVTGYRNLANSNAKNAFISGKQNTVNGPWSISGGANNTNNGEASIVVGTGIINSSAINSALFGYGHTGTGNRNLLAGTSNTVSAGNNVVLLGNNLTGNSSTANTTSQVVVGQYNNTPDTDAIFVVGTGVSTAKHNTLVVKNNDITVNGNINVHERLYINTDELKDVQFTIGSSNDNTTAAKWGFGNAGTIAAKYNAYTGTTNYNNSFFSYISSVSSLPNQNPRGFGILRFPIARSSTMIGAYNEEEHAWDWTISRGGSANFRQVNIEGKTPFSLSTYRSGKATITIDGYIPSDNDIGTTLTGHIDDSVLDDTSRIYWTITLNYEGPYWVSEVGDNKSLANFLVKVLQMNVGGCIQVPCTIKAFQNIGTLGLKYYYLDSNSIIPAYLTLNSTSACSITFSEYLGISCVKDDDGDVSYPTTVSIDYQNINAQIRCKISDRY